MALGQLKSRRWASAFQQTATVGLFENTADHQRRNRINALKLRFRDFGGHPMRDARM
jgi:hypothetical protein